MNYVVKLKDVKNVVTKERGYLLLSAYKYEEEESQYDNTTGLVIHFQPEGKEPIYVKSLVLVPSEVTLLENMEVSCVTDIGYIMKFSNAEIDILDLGRHSTNHNLIQYGDEQYCVDTYAKYSFELDIPRNEWNNNSSNIMREWNANNKRCGMYKVISKAVHGTNLIPRDSNYGITPYKLPENSMFSLVDYMDYTRF